jgi:hypothetical protein
MLPFLWTFGVISFLIVCGVCLSLYLSKQGVFGPRGYGRTRRSQMLVEDEESAVDDENGVEPYTKVIGADAESASYARRGLLVLLGGLVVVVLLLSSLLSAVLH